MQGHLSLLWLEAGIEVMVHSYNTLFWSTVTSYYRWTHATVGIREVSRVIELPVKARHCGGGGSQAGVNKAEAPFPQDKVHWLGSRCCFCTGGAKSVDLGLLYNTLNTTRVSG